VYQLRDTLFVEQYGSCLGRRDEFEKSRITTILDELVAAAEIAETANQQGRLE